MQLCAYLTFTGNCREAMEFYQACIGGKLDFQTVGESPLAGTMPAKMKSRIMHATLTNGSLVIMGSDMTPQSGCVSGNAVSLLLNFPTEDETRECYERLVQGGSADHPLNITFWGALFGDLTDKYGNHWLLNCALTSTQVNVTPANRH